MQSVFPMELIESKSMPTLQNLAVLLWIKLNSLSQSLVYFSMINKTTSLHILQVLDMILKKHTSKHLPATPLEITNLKLIYTTV